MIRRDTDVSGARLDHLQHGLQHADHGAEGPVLPFGETAKAVEMAVQLVGAVDEMNDHAFAAGRSRSSLRSRGLRPSDPGVRWNQIYQALPAKSNEIPGTRATGIGVQNLHAESLSSSGFSLGCFFLPALRRSR